MSRRQGSGAISRLHTAKALNGLAEVIAAALVASGMTGPDGEPLPFTLVLWPDTEGPVDMVSTAPRDQVTEALRRLVGQLEERERLRRPHGVGDIFDGR